MLDHATIIQLVAKYHNLTVEELMARKKTEPIVMARHKAVWLIRQFLNLTLSDIAKIFNRHHATILNSIEVINALYKYDTKITNDINVLSSYIAALKPQNLNIKEYSETKMKVTNLILIAGPISNDNDWANKFNLLKIFYTSLYRKYNVMTPLDTDALAYTLYGNTVGKNEYESIFLSLLCLAHTLVLTPDWESSEFVKIEYKIAQLLNKKIIFDDSIYKYNDEWQPKFDVPKSIDEK